MLNPHLKGKKKWEWKKENTFGFSPFELSDDHCKGSYEDEDHSYSQNGYENRNKEPVLLLLLLSLARDWRAKIWICAKTCTKQNVIEVKSSIKPNTKKRVVENYNGRYLSVLSLSLNISIIVWGTEPVSWFPVKLLQTQNIKY